MPIDGGSMMVALLILAIDRWWCLNCGSERTGEDIQSRCLTCANKVRK